MTALVNQETGVRGYVLSGSAQFLQPYRQGRAVERESFAQLAGLLRDEDLERRPPRNAARAAQRATRGTPTTRSR